MFILNQDKIKKYKLVIFVKSELPLRQVKIWRVNCLESLQFKNFQKRVKGDPFTVLINFDLNL